MLGLAVSGLLLLTPSGRTLPPLSEAISSLAEPIWQRQVRPLPANSRIAVWPFRSRNPSAAAILRGLLVSALEAKAQQVTFDLQRSDVLASRFQPSVWDARALRRVRDGMACDRLLTGALSVGSERSYLQVIVWDLRAGHALEAFDTTFETPPTWVESTASDPLPYALLWRSHAFMGIPLLALAVGDFDGDAFNELALIADRDVHWRRWNGWDMVTTERAPQTYWGNQPELHRRGTVRTAFVLSKRERDELWLSVPPDWSGSDRDFHFQKGGMVVAVSAGQIWRSAFRADLPAFSARETIQQSPDGEVRRVPLPEDYRRLRVANLDDSPEREFLLLTPEGSLKVYRHRGEAWQLWWQSPPNFGSALAVGDLDGNGLAEIAVSGRGNELEDQIWILEWDGSVFSTRSHWSLQGAIQDLVVGDVNQDDIPELTVLLRQPHNSLLLFYQYQPTLEGTSPLRETHGTLKGHYGD